MWLFELVPQTLFYLAFLVSGTGYVASLSLPHSILQKQVKIACVITLAVSIYLLGMLYVNNSWKLRAEKLQQQVAELTQKSSETNTVIKNRLVTRTETIRLRGDDIVKYVDREVVKYNQQCVIPQEFVNVHNLSAEQPK